MVFAIVLHTQRNHNEGERLSYFCIIPGNSPDNMHVDDNIFTYAWLVWLSGLRASLRTKGSLV